MPHPFPTVRPDAYREARERIRRAALEAREADREAARTIRRALSGPISPTVAAELLDAAR